MTQDILALAGDFPTLSREAWLALVDKALKGAPFEKKMVTKTHEGFSIQPIYTRADWPSTGDPSGFPGVMPFTRGGTAAGAVLHGWDVRQEHAHPDPTAANAQILTDLERGASSVTLRFDAAGRAGFDSDDAEAADLAGVEGMMIASLDDLDTALAGVFLDGAVVGLQAGAAFEPAAALLAALWARRQIAPAAALGAFNADPLGTLAATGSLPMSAARALSRLGALAAHTARSYPQATAVMVDGAPYHDGGANEVQTLAAVLSTGVAYLRAMEAAGLSVDEAAAQMVFSLPLDADIFLGVAKLRAARRLWARVLEASGASEPSRAMRLHATTARRVLTRRDPWVNMLRGTVSCFAGAVGGADSIAVAPFDAALGVATDFSRRIARNVQVILLEECNLGRVNDPAGGSWYVETLTDRLAREAWSAFQGLEAEGGMVAALESGALAGRIAATWDDRRKAIAKRKDPLTGISEFPNLAEAPVATTPVDLAALRQAATARLSAARRDGVAPGDFAAAIEAVGTGATLGALTRALGDGAALRVPAVAPHVLAEDFEALRDASDDWLAAHGQRPKIFLANLGPVAQHTARATFAKNFFEAGGIEAVAGAGFDEAADCVAAWRDSGAKVAILCSSDGLYETKAEDMARALKAAGVSRLYLAGAPGERRALYDAAGVDAYIQAGSDVLGVLGDLHAHLGLAVEGSAR
ncbi:methylmalonyl-CoA mutase [Rhodospirillum rubrum]|uniref:methylmalonyl-CoA mutase family protein n=1 Tax=Rhodospirillum rubrum TaxID=1085 RepID=UPI0019068C61|nr:methylmalonyl-CoA mutase family protein [Rhodospirillum rubrum]MBK1665858.1 methylmalonyl-CoA mutase [Rhodospirillum rubrum]MBK1677961.1 methylmalonyl-CoA mutase [Rhodospirillum rubrum]